MFSCKQAVNNKAEQVILKKSQRDIVTSQIETPRSSFTELIIDTFPEGFVDLVKIDSSILTDIRYATDSNFTNQNLYPCARCILKKEVAKKLSLVNQELTKKGYRLKMLDCYRPLSVQKVLWETNPDSRFVMSPSKGSGHSRGTAVDVTLVSRDGQELNMGSSYDEFSGKAFYNYAALPDEVKRLRWILKTNMQEKGFNALRTEWWHFQYGNRKAESVMDFTWKCK